MSRRDTAIGYLERTDPVKWRAELTEAIERNEGQMMNTAHELGISRQHLYRMIARARLWPVIDAARDRLVKRREQLDRMIALEIPPP